MTTPSTIALATAFALYFLPTTAWAEALRYSGLFGGVTYGHFAYENRDGGTEPGWGPTFGAFWELSPLPLNFLTLSIEGSYLRIGSGPETHFRIADDQPSFGASPPIREAPSPARRESRHYLSEATLLKLTADGPLDAYLELGPTVNLRFPEGNTYSTGLVFGGAYGLGVAVPIGRHHLILDARYMHHWSSSADDYDAPSAARALMFLGKFGF